MKKISLIFGTRPEAIKLAPVIIGLKKTGLYQVEVCVTAQHRQMLDQVLAVFDIVPDVDMNLMKPDQTLGSLTADALRSIDEYLLRSQPDIVLVQGDTTTVLAAALAACYRKVPVGHIEAGLRTGNKRSPFPEELNRVVTSQLTDIHFAPTVLAKQNLIDEGIKDSTVYITGNTVIDALFMTVETLSRAPVRIPELSDGIMDSGKETPLVLITGHRRENFGEGFINICKSIARLAESFPGTEFVYPVHLNPHVQSPVYSLLSGTKNIHLIPPLSYLPFVALMQRSTLVLTDSGGVQEEAPSLGKPVLVMRENTERPEAVQAGTVRMVGTDEHRIVEEVSTLLENRAEYLLMANAVNPYGDGKATDRIIQALAHYFVHSPAPEPFSPEEYFPPQAVEKFSMIHAYD